MAPQHSEYFKLKKFEKQRVQEELSDLSLKKVIRPGGERCPLYTWKEGASVSPKTGGHREESE